MRTALHDGWSLHLDRDAPGRAPVPGLPPEVAAAASADGPGVPATVPGTVHTDLMAAGLIGDPYLDDAERRLAWVGQAGWTYRRSMGGAEAGAQGGHDRLDLVLGGLDTVATVTVDGAVVARTADMHRSHRIDVGGLLHEGGVLSVTFDSPVRAADAASVALGVRPHVNTHPYNAIRKMACSFGWDWGPDLATSGIWRGQPHLHAWSTARLAGVRPLATVDDVTGDRPTGRLAVHVEIERAGRSEAPLTVRASVAPPGGALDAAPVSGRAEVAPGATTAVVEVEVPDVALWWPVGHGGQPLHRVDVALSTGSGDDADDAPLDAWDGAVGFRTVVFDTSADTQASGPHGVLGSRATLVVNGRPVFVKGVNWIPDDAFPHRVVRERCAARADQALDAGANLLRVWGGGLYESEDLYDVCDERGLMVVQDFPFACAAYAEEEPLRSQVEAEVRENVARLAPHPSLVLWSGCNENLWGHEDWGWKARLDGRTWGEGYYHDLLPRTVAELDPHRPYLPGSPFSSYEPVSAGGLHPNDEDHGTVHLWEQWNELDYTTYRDHAPRFAAEYGWQGPPTMATLRRSISDAPLTPVSPGMLVHQKAISGNDKLTDGLVPHFRVPDAMDDWHWATSLNQARAVTTGVEHFRSLSPHCSGSVYWQLNDCWPVTSWAVVDGDGRAKPAFFALRHAHADRLLTIQPRPGGLALVVVNDTARAFDGKVAVTREGFDGTVSAEAVLDVVVEARATVEVLLPGDVATPERPGSELVVARAPDEGGGGPGGRALWFFAEDRDTACARQEDVLTATVHPVDGGYRVDLAASALVRDVAVLADRLDPAATVDDMLLTLLAGESASVHVTTAAILGAGDLVSREVLRSANQLVTDVPASQVAAARAVAGGDPRLDVAPGRSEDAPWPPPST